MTETPEKIYLLHHEGPHGEHVWCDHVPDNEMHTTTYIRSDMANLTMFDIANIRQTLCQAGNQLRTAMDMLKGLGLHRNKAGYLTDFWLYMERTKSLIEEKCQTEIDRSGLPYIYGLNEVRQAISNGQTLSKSEAEIMHRTAEIYLQNMGAMPFSAIGGQNDR